MNKRKYVLWAYPAVMLVAQVVLPTELLIGGAIFFFGAVLIPKLRSFMLLFGVTFIGHYLWLWFVELVREMGLSGEGAIIAGRFGLVGYLMIFAIWLKLSPTNQNYFHLGNKDSNICFPLIWYGKKESILRFVLIFSGMCIIAILTLAFLNNISIDIILMGILFTIINATLEELLWRGFILSRTVDLIGDKQGLIITSLVFGLYHISLGFPLWACLVFAIGGFYMGGCAIISKGLLGSWIMHISVNIIFVFAGLIFY